MNIFKEDGTREIDFDLQKSAIKLLKKQWSAHAGSIEAYPGNFKGRGIVMCAGGIKYFTCAWIAVKILRKLGCRLPVEIWYQANELSPACISEIEKHNVRCVNFSDKKGSMGLYGWMLKPFAILNSSFKEVIFIDADNTCLQNPTSLFETGEYRATGALFWPDYWKTAADNPIWNILGLKYCDMHEQESGQIVINKEKCWKPLNLCLYFNRQSNIYYRLLLGDKDTFRFAWLALSNDFHMISKAPDTCGYIDKNNDFMGITMLQYDQQGSPFFLHRNLIKWDVSNTDEFLWQKVKQFKTASVNKTFVIGFSDKNGHHYMDFKGDYDCINFKSRFGNVEEICLDHLNRIRKKKFYHDFLLSSYLQSKRIQLSQQ